MHFFLTLIAGIEVRGALLYAIGVLNMSLRQASLIVATAPLFFLQEKPLLISVGLACTKRPAATAFIFPDIANACVIALLVSAGAVKSILVTWFQRSVSRGT